ncbi:hypothetical protein [Halosimplex halobium]|uniref:hypothetical protein n=1 Tax=Halosimplex halobium TaxID=3396618 RepID=UPI003F559908
MEKHQAEIKPDLKRVSEYSISEEDENKIQFKLKNVGRGEASNLHLKPQVYVLESADDQEDTDEDVMRELTELSDFLKDEETEDIPTLTPRSATLDGLHKDSVMSFRHGGVLSAGESKEFEARIHFDNIDRAPTGDYDEDEYPSTVVYSLFLEVMKKTDASMVGIQFKIAYEDILGYTGNCTLQGRSFEVTEVDETEDTLKSFQFDKKVFYNW